MKHKHCEIIKAWAEGAEIEVKTVVGNWKPAGGNPDWHIADEYRIKPPAPKWPESTMRAEDFCELGFGNLLARDTRTIANAALAHACETGQVVLPTDKDKR